MKKIIESDEVYWADKSVADILDAWPGSIKGILNRRAYEAGMTRSQFIATELCNSAPNRPVRQYVSQDEKQSAFQKQVHKILESSWVKEECPNAREASGIKRFLTRLAKRNWEESDLSPQQLTFWDVIVSYYEEYMQK